MDKKAVIYKDERGMKFKFVEENGHKKVKVWVQEHQRWEPFSPATEDNVRLGKEAQIKEFSKGLKRIDEGGK